MSFVNTIWLWGFAALAIPIAVHLLSRKQGKVIRFGSIRHLDETNTRQFKAIRLNEIALLILRCLVIALLVLILAGLQFDIFEKKNKILLIENGIESDPRYTELIDSMKSTGFEIRNFGQEVQNANIDYWSHLQKMNPADEIVFFSYGFVERFKGKRIGLPQGVRWLSADPKPTEYDLNAIQLSADSALVRRGISHRDKTSFDNLIASKQSVNSSIIETPDTITVAVVFDAHYQYDRKILLAALEAIKSMGTFPLTVQQIQAGQYKEGVHDWIVWLADKGPPKTKNLILMDENNASGERLFQPMPSTSNKLWLLTKRLNEEVALRENLTVQLAMILQPEKKYTDRANDFDRRLSPEQLRWSSSYIETEKLISAADNEAALKLISIALMIVLVSERLLAYNKNQ